MLKKRFVRYFSLLSKVPKTLPPEEKKSFLSSLFSTTTNSPTYTLLKQMFVFLDNCTILKVEFPFLKNNERFEESWMIFHCYLLKSRLEQEKQLPTNELEKFSYNLQTYFFPEYAKYLNPFIPVRNFASHYSQSYYKRLEVYTPQLKQVEKNAQPPLSFHHYASTLRKIVYQNRLPIQNHELIKLCKYFIAHKRYLDMLEWSDMVEYKVKWGFEGYVKEIQSYSK